MIELFLAFFVLINVAAFSLYAISKHRRINKNVLLLFSLACGGIGAYLGMRLIKHKSKAGRLLALIGVTIALVPLTHIAHALTLDKIVRYVEIEFYSENWPVELNGYRIAFMTDFHIISDESMKGIASELNKRNIDLLLLGGDFSMTGGHYQGTLREISQIVTTDGIFGAEGNHDEYVQLFSAKEQHGIASLDNNGLHVRQGFYLAGVQDLWNRNPNISEAIKGAGSDDFVLLLSHNPDVSMQQSTEGVDLILSGHTHGGQITFFGFPMYLLRGTVTHYGTLFAYGFAYSADDIPVFVSRHIGVYYSVPRVFARPEVVIFTMNNK